MRTATLIAPKKAGHSWRLKFYHGRVLRWLTLYRGKEESETAKGWIERIVSFRESGRELNAAMLNWLDANGAIRDKFAEWGIVDGETAAAIKPISELLTQWDAMTGGGLNPHHRKERMAKARAVIAACRFRNLLEVSAPKVSNFLEKLLAAGRSYRTFNLYLTDFRTFLNWCTAQGAIPANPLRGLKTRNAETDRRRIRRALSDDEISALLAAAADGASHHGLTGHERELVYRLALETGFRWNEIHTLERRDIDPAAQTARVQARNAKNRKAAANRISGELAAALADYMSARPALPGARLFPGMWRERGGAMIAADLRAAGITPRNDAGEIIDFHSLRHTLATRLARANTPQHYMKQIMRHASITTTDKHYTHADDNGVRAALAAVALPSFTPAAVAMAKTGTAGEVTGDFRCTHYCTKTGTNGCKSGATTGGIQIIRELETPTKNPENIGFPGFNSGAGKETRTLGLQSHNRLFAPDEPATTQHVASKPENPLHQLSHQNGRKSAQSGQPLTPARAAGNAPTGTPARPDGETANPGEGTAPATPCTTRDNSTPAPASTAPGTALGATESAAGGLAGIVDALRAELAAQRAENAALRKTIEALTATLAKLAGAGASAD